MNIHEYQAKALIRKFGVAVPDGHVAYSADEAVDAAQKLGGGLCVVKAQIHAGGRGKAGGVKVAKTTDDVRSLAKSMLGMTLVTHQTGPVGKVVKRIYVEAGCDIKRELYLGMLVDRATSRITIMASEEGGMEIEEVAAKNPEKILKIAVDPATGVQPFHAREVAFFLKLTGNQIGSATKFILALYKAFTELDCSIVEINPLVITGAGDVLALDAKINFDDNALFRQPDIMEMRDEDEEEPLERRAKKFDLMADINIRGTFLLTKACLPQLRKSANPHVLTIAPPLNLNPHWLGVHPEYTLSKYGMSLLSLGWAVEFRDAGIAFNCLWPQTYIATAAVANLAEGDDLAARSRSPQIMADAAVEIFSRPAGAATAQCFIDSAVLSEAGVSDLSRYGGGPDPIMDIFVDRR